MHQRLAIMKPAAMESRVKIDMYDLIEFLNEAQQRFQARQDEDTAFAFEMLSEYFQNDYKPGAKLKFTGGAVGL